MDFNALRAEFPREAISWRAQTVSKDGAKALALAYIDARDVMNRLDEVCGPENWEDSYIETAKGRIIGTIAIRIGGEWVRKSDGAGETDVEGDKGAISDALKRAAVKWGIGRYLYDMPNVWVPCESSERNGKRYWSKWTSDPWQFVRGAPKPAVLPKSPEVMIGEMLESEQEALRKLNEVTDPKRLDVWFEDNKPIIDSADEASKKILRAAYSAKKKGLEAVQLLNAA